MSNQQVMVRERNLSATMGSLPRDGEIETWKSASTLNRFRSLLAKKGLASVDVDKTYQAIHDALLSKVNDVSGRRTVRLPNGDVARVRIPAKR